MKPIREMLDFNCMMEFYLRGKSVARHGWEKPIDDGIGYIFTEDDQRANDWMVVEED